MNVPELAKAIELRHPKCDSIDIARLSLVILNSLDDPSVLADEDRLEQACRDAVMRHQFATDQHAAMAEELEALAASDPAKFDRDQIWILVRAIKVQSQVLQMYLGDVAIDV